MTKRKPPSFRECAICGERFLVRNGSAKTCSPACRDELELRRERAYVRIVNDPEKRRLYMRQYMLMHPRPAPRVQPSPRPCRTCGTVFFAKGTTCYCSEGCRAKRARQKSKAYYDSHPEMIIAKKRRQTIRNSTVKLLTNINRLRDDRK